MNALQAATPSLDPAIVLKIAREIGADMRPLEEILRIYQITPEDWGQLSQSPQFLKLVRNCAVEWESVSNTAERVRLKSLAFVEESLPEFYARAHDTKEPLSAKVEVLKSVSRLAGIGERGVDGVGAGERMIVNINLGADHKISFTKDVTPVVTLEGDHA